MNSRTTGRYDTPTSGEPNGQDGDVDRRRAGRYDRRRSRSNSPDRGGRRHGGGVGGERYARHEAMSHYPHPGFVHPGAAPYMPQPYTAAPYAPMGPSGGMNPDQLLQLLQRGAPSVNNAPPASQPMPQQVSEDVQNSQSVQDFIPTVPKSLLGLLRGNNESEQHSYNNAGLGDSNAALSSGNADASQQQQPVNALALLEAPKIAPEVMRRAREARRAHISGFPANTTEEELMDFFRLLMPDIRRVKTQREVRELALAAGDSEDDIRQIPGNAQVEVDRLRGVQMRLAKSKAFAFIEASMADLITEMVEECAKDPERFVFHPAGSHGEGRGYPIAVRRPKDFEPLDGHDDSRVVMTGFHPSLPEDKLRAAMEQFGPLEKFDAKNGFAYAEFQTLKDAVDCRTDLHGEVLGQKMVVVLPLYHWLACVCHAEGIDVTVHEDDPISGKFALTHDLFGPGGVLSSSSHQHHHNNGGSGADGLHGSHTGGPQGSGFGPGALTLAGGNAMAGGASGSGALVLTGNQADAQDPMKELLAMSLPLPEVVHRLGLLYPHLRPLYGNTQVAIFPTRVLALLNLFDEEELVLDSTYSRLLADIEQEVEKYGRVEELIVPRREGRPKAPEAPHKEDFTEAENPEEAFAQAQSDYEDARKAFTAALDKFFDRQIHPIYGGFGRVFVVYETVDEAAEAQRHIAGKLFGGRTVVTSFVFEDLLHEDASDAKGADDDDEEAQAEEEEGEEVAEGNNGDDTAEGKEERGDVSEPREEDNAGTVEDLD